MPEISIIVPVYKTEKYLPQCIESILAQTFADFELILVDDGSPDNSGIICDEYAAKDSRIQVIHQENAGVSAARNAGLDQAIGTYIMFCDSDDWVEPEWCASLYEGITKNDVAMAICGHKEFHREKGNIIKKMIDSSSCIPLQEWFGFYPHMCFVWDKILHREQIVQHNVRFPIDIAFAEDTRFIMQYLRTYSGKESFWLLSNSPYNYRIAGESLSRRYVKGFWEMEKTLINEIASTSQYLYTDMDRYMEHFRHLCYFVISTSIRFTFHLENDASVFHKYSMLSEILHSNIFSMAMGASDVDHFPGWYRFLMKRRITPVLFIYNLFKN